MRSTTVHVQGHGTAVAQAQSRLQAVGQTLQDDAILGRARSCAGWSLLGQLDAVDHHVDVVLVVALQGGQGASFDDLSIHPKAHKALCLQVRKDLGELALALAHQWRQEHHAAARGPVHQSVDHLRHRLRLQRQVVVGTKWCAGAREQEPQIVVDFGDRAHRRARVVAGGLLLNADGWRQALDDVHIGLVHALEELAGVGRQAFDVAALAFGIQGVKGQAGLARTRQAGDHHQLLTRQIQIQVLEVVGASATDVNAIGLWSRPGWRNSARNIDRHSGRNHGRI